MSYLNIIFYGSRQALIVKKSSGSGQVYILKGDNNMKFRGFSEMVQYYTVNKSAGNPTMPLLRLPDEVSYHAERNSVYNSRPFFLAQ
jgi:hypothetical protein